MYLAFSNKTWKMCTMFMTFLILKMEFYYSYIPENWSLCLFNNSVFYKRFFSFQISKAIFEYKTMLTTCSTASQLTRTSGSIICTE